MTRDSWWCFNGDGGTTRQENEFGKPIRKKFVDMTDEELLELCAMLPGTAFSSYVRKAEYELEFRASIEKYEEASCQVKI